MKKLIVAVAACSLIATPALADGYRGGHEHRGHHGGGWVAPLLGGLIIGGIIGSRNAERYPPPQQQVVVVQQPQPMPVTVCEPAHYLRDEFGNIRRDQYGYDIVVPQRCWYQY